MDAFNLQQRLVDGNGYPTPETVLWFQEFAQAQAQAQAALAAEVDQLKARVVALENP